ncbi:MAG TPA: RHS repeat-associated core domain-containing protein [Luteibacter sp.]|jgi:RHS repeat-associated protein|uniref:RHS repeat-associated core domain-containing protein n=1 Tax=Luteibacter sp. TaxID=1886636 RepID=UPI002F4191BF
MSSYSGKLPKYSALALAVSAVLTFGATPTRAQQADTRFASYEDGFTVIGRLIGIDDPFAVHVGMERFDEVVDIAVKNFCEEDPTCHLDEVQQTRVAGEAGKSSEYTKTEIIVIFGQFGSIQKLHPIDVVRSCPDGAMLVDDKGEYWENRSPPTSSVPVACTPSDRLPQGGDLGIPSEDGANQCPIGNAPTVGNPINPLTLSKVERVVDYADPSGSGLNFARTYHSGAAALRTDLATAYRRDAEPSRMGARWRHSWDRSIVPRPYYDGEARAYGNAATLILEDGREITFRRVGKNYEGLHGERGKLRDRSGGGWVYTWPDLTEESFDERGQLVSRVSANGQAFTFHYQAVGQGGPKGLTGVTDPQGREIHISYNKQGRINGLTTPDGGRIRYDHADKPLNGDYDLLSVQYADGRAIGYIYDERAHTSKADHKLTGIAGGDGKRFSSYSYDEFGRAVRSSHGDDLEWTELWERGNNEVTVSSKDRRYSEYWETILTEGRTRLATRTESIRDDEHERTFSYLDNGLVGNQTDYLGTATTYRYDDARGLETERTEAAGTPAARTVRTTWHPTFDKPVRIDDGAHWTSLTYDTRGNLTEQREGGLADAANPRSSAWPDERITRYVYDPAGRVTSIDGPIAGDVDTTRYSYRASDAPGCAGGPATCTWRKGDLHTSTNGLGHVATVLAYDAAGRVVASTDVNGIRTDRRYDAAGRPLEIAIRARADGSPSAADAITRMTYNANGDLETLTDPDGARLKYTYDAAHRLVERVDSLGNRQLIGRDDQGLMGSETHLRGDGTEDAHREYTYDTHGVMEGLRDRNGYAISFLADANGRSTGQDGNTTKVALLRDARGRVTRRTEGKSLLTAQTNFTYDGADNIKTVVDPKGLSTGYLRNGIGDLLWQRSPDTGETAFENDEAGQPVGETPADGRAVGRQFDALGRLTTLTYSDGKQTRFSYDTAPSDCGPGATFAIGRLSSATDRDGGTTSFCYDFAGQVVAKKQTVRGVSLTLRYDYTPAGRVSAMTYPDGRRVAYTRDAMGSVIDVTLHDSGVRPVLTSIARDALGRPTRWTAGARTIERLYNPQGAVTRVSDGRADGLDLSIVYADGNVKTLTSHGTAISVTHNVLGQVTATGPTSARHAYTYDKTGNRLTWTASPSPVQRFEYPADSHRLIMAAGVLRGYDLNGNTTQIDERQFVYDASGRMSQAKVNGIVEMNYAYSPFGQQVARYIAGQTTISLHDEAGHWIGDYDGVGQPIRQMVWLGDLPLAAIDGEAIRDIQPDHLGSPRVVIDRASDKAIWSWSATGEAFGSTPPNEDPDKDGTKYVLDMRFPGQRFDAVTGLFQNGWRDYDPTSGRYVQSDPIGLGGGVSTYSYANGNPLVNVDPMGLDSSVGPVESALIADIFFLKNYRDMRNANTIGADKYFHCKANCQAARLGVGGAIESRIVSEVRELTDQYVKGDPSWACDEDRAANALGRNGGRSSPSQTCSAVCAPLRPNGLPEEY